VPTRREHLLGDTSAGKGDLFAEVGNQNDANPCFLPDLLFYFTGAAHGDYDYRFGSGGTFDRVIRSEWWSHRSH
jgi:hypothetical protein